MNKKEKKFIESIKMDRRTIVNLKIGNWFRMKDGKIQFCKKYDPERGVLFQISKKMYNKYIKEV